jgi:hypothetical protein
MRGNVMLSMHLQFTFVRWSLFKPPKSAFHHQRMAWINYTAASRPLSDVSFGLKADHTDKRRNGSFIRILAIRPIEMLTTGAAKRLYSWETATFFCLLRNQAVIHSFGFSSDDESDPPRSCVEL